MAHLITGIFHSRENAEHAVDDLIRAGFSHNDVSLLMTDKTKARDFDIKKATKAPEGAATGAAIGGTLGAVAAGPAAGGRLTNPGFALFAAGPLVAALTGLGAGAAAGGITGALVGLGVPEHEAKFYKGELERGHILVGVHVTDDRMAQARAILDSAGAERVTT